MAKINKEGKAFADGWDAREDGELRTSANLIEDAAERTAWLEGWDAANKLAVDITPEEGDSDRDARWNGAEGLAGIRVYDEHGNVLKE